MARKQKTIHYLYKTTCLITGRYYIGMHSTSNLNDGYMGSGKRLRYSIRKYGIDNHKKEILEFFETRELLVEAEKKAITEDMITDNNCMNLKGGGTGGFINEEHRQKAIKSAGLVHANRMKLDKEYYLKVKTQLLKNVTKLINDGKWVNPNKGHWNGRKHSEETKQKMSESSKGMGKGETNSQYGTCWITKDGLNKKIKKEDLETYLKEGWIKGRKKVKINLEI